MSIWTDVQGAFRRPLPQIPLRVVALLAITIVLVVAVVFWQPLERFVGNILPNPAPVVQPNVPVIVVPSQTPSATPLPTETITPTPTPTPTVTLTATPTLTPTVTPVPPMTKQDAEAYIQANCSWISLAKIMAYPPENRVVGTSQGMDILDAYPGASLGIFADDEYNMTMVCIFSPFLERLTGQYGFIFVNEKGEVEVVLVTLPSP